MESIGERAAKEIMRRVKYEKVKPELDRINIPVECYYSWANGSRNPSAQGLKQLALAGYDVHYILTGERKDNA